MTTANLIIEAKAMPPAALNFARGISEVRTPDHLVPLRETVRRKHRRELDSLFAAINERFGPSEAVIGVFYAAGEMAIMAEVGRSALDLGDQRLLMQLWTALRNAG